VEFSLDAGAFHPLKFVVPSHVGGANLNGSWLVIDRDTPGVEAFLLNEVDYANWQSGYTTYRYYDSGTSREGMLDVPLLAWSPGVYYLVFKNDSTVKTPRRVHANVDLAYSDMWWPGKIE
jgi:hypothetical protein